jgi:hypothetical protein
MYSVRRILEANPTNMKNFLCRHGLHWWKNYWSYDNPKYACAWCGLLT